MLSLYLSWRWVLSLVYCLCAQVFLCSFIKFCYFFFFSEKKKMKSMCEIDFENYKDAHICALHLAQKAPDFMLMYDWVLWAICYNFSLCCCFSAPWCVLYPFTSYSDQNCIRMGFRKKKLKNYSPVWEFLVLVMKSNLRLFMLLLKLVVHRLWSELLRRVGS